MSDDTGATPDEPTPAEKPAPRPRSATSRARRIGGAAATARPDTKTADDTTDGPAAEKTTTPKATSKATAGAAAAGVAKKPAKPTENAKNAKNAKTAKSAKATATTPEKKSGADDDEDDSPRSSTRQLTLSVPGWLQWAPGFAFAAVAVVFLTLFLVAQLGGDDAPSSTSASTRQEVLAAAKTCLATLNTYRYDQIDKAETAGANCTTGKLTSDYKKTVTTVIRKNAPPLKAIQLAKINAAGIEAVTRNGKQWTILAYGQLNITTANTGKQGRIDPFAVVARLEQVKGKWLLAKVDTVSSFSN